MPPAVFPTTNPVAVRAPVWRVAIAGKDVTRDVSPMVLSVTYTDHSHGKSDDVELELEDSSGKWRGAWYPTKGDTLALWMGYVGEPLVACGTFEIDELEPAGPPHKLTIRGLASGVTPSLRTKRSQAYEGQTLREIAQAIADRHALTLTGTVADLRVERKTQDREEDLAYLKRLADKYGFVFTVKGEQLVFYELATLLAAKPVFTVRPTDVKEYRFKDTTHAVYRSAVITYDDPKTKKPIKQTVDADDVDAGDVLTINDRAENAQQALVQARAALQSANMHETEGTITVEGDPRLVAGVNVTVDGFGAVDGSYHAETTTHKMTRADGYTTAAELKTIPGAKKIKLPKKAATP